MPVLCLVEIKGNGFITLAFDAVPRAGDLVMLPGIDGGPPHRARVDHVIFHPSGTAAQNVELLVTPQLN